MGEKSEGMEKYSVVIDEEKTKQAGTHQTCETCHETFQVFPEQTRCPLCGSTKNFEKRR